MTKIETDTKPLRLKIGTIERVYILRKTNAPAEYDGFGTLTIYKSAENRYVLIEDKNFQWQESRYYSGNYRCEHELDIPLATLEDTLFSAMCSALKAVPTT